MGGGSARSVSPASHRPGVVAEIVPAFTEAVTAVFGDDCRDEVLVELVGQPTSRSGLGGEVIGDGCRQSSIRSVAVSVGGGG